MSRDSASGGSTEDNTPYIKGDIHEDVIETLKSESDYMNGSRTIT